MADTVVAFGLNKTLIRQNSWYELNLAMGISEQEDQVLYGLGPESEGILSFKEWIDILARLMVKRGKASRQKIEEVLLDFTYLDGAKEAVAALKARGCKVGIISGTFDVIAQKVAADLGGLDFSFCNASLRFDEHDMLAGIDLKNNDDFAFKADCARQLRAQYPDDEICYVSDGDNDEQIFQTVKGILLDTKSTVHESWKQQAVQAGAQFSATRAQSAAHKTIASIAEVPAVL